jgi:acetyltransferase-like isoleucine patch superfamily enzyme
VEIGDDCWIGAAAIILPGTRIRRGSTVAAGSVVMGRFPPNSVIAGNPATVIMSIGDAPATKQG